MSSDRIVPTSAPSDVPSYAILSDGSEISGTYQVSSIAVYKEANRIAAAKLILLDGDAASEDFVISNSDEFAPGRELEIKLGYHSQNETVFKGIVIKHSIKASSNKPSQLVVECRDKAITMTVGRKNAYFAEVTDSEIIEELAEAHGLDSQVEATRLSHKEMVQHYTTDWDFVMSRAEMNGLLIYTDDGTLVAAPPDPAQEPALSLVYGSTLIDFEAEMDARCQYAAVTAGSWDYSGQELIESEAEEPTVTEQGNISAGELADVIGLDKLELRHTGQVIDEELQLWADAKLLRARLAKIRGRARCQGTAVIKPGTVLELHGVGDRFIGKAFVSGIRHQLTSESWLTDIQFGLNPEWFAKRADIIDTPAAGLVPAIRGLQIGVVVQLQDDPDGEDRVLVRLPVIDTQAEGVWARVSTLDAGNERGSFFRPEIDDEVIVGFLNDDPRDAVILGMLNSSAKPAPIAAADDNHEKGFVTRSGMKLIFNDDKQSITLETPNGNTLVISDDEGAISVEDENGNTATLDSGGIAFESPSDIKLKASGDVMIEGTNVNIKANAEFKAEGTAGAQVTTSAVATLKGSLVQIN